MGITRGPDGNLWFAEIHAIGRITPEGQVTEYTTGLAPDSEPVEITAGPDGNLWFTEGVTDRIGRITPAGFITEFAVPGTGSRQVFVDGITAGPDGNIWFTEQGGAIGRITPTGKVAVFPTNSVGTLPSQPNLIAAGPDGNLWWTDTAGFVGRITPTGLITKFAAGITDPINSQPFGIAAGPDGNVWFTESGTDRIGRITPAGVITEFSAGITSKSVPGDITAGPDGNLWFTEDGGNGIGRISTAGVVTEFTTGISPGSDPNGIAAGPDGNLWFTEFLGSRIGRLAVPQAAATTTTLSTSTATAVFGQTELLTATVSSAAGAPTGTVTFKDGSVVLGSAPINAAGQATLKVSLGVGIHALTASFTATSAFGGSSSAVLPELVDRAMTTVALSPSVNTVVTGQSVSFTATVTAVAPGAGTPTGWVTFKDGNVILATVMVGAGSKATFTTSFAITGGHAVTALYSGDQNFVGSSQTTNELVNVATTRKVTTTGLFTPAKPVLVGQTVTFTATVRDPAGTATPTGTVTFFVGNVAVATVRLDAGGQARLTGVFTIRGTFTLRAVYSGDGTFAGSWHSLTEQVN
jgi:streptogramin lyase